MKRIILLLLITSIISCKKENIKSIPSYLAIENILLSPNSTHNITDAWVYVDDILQGVYELPANFPVLEDGKHKLRIKAGIMDNGIAGTRIPYPFYSSYIIDEQEFSPELTMSITPEVSYLQNINLFLEDFENGLNLETDSITFSRSDVNMLDGYYGLLTLNDSIFSTEVTTDKLEDLPQAGAPVYLELDYKSNTRFLVGVYVNFPQGVVLQKDLLWINPKEDWSKIYVNLTSTVSEAVGAESFKVFIGMQNNSLLDFNTLYFDNLKVIY